MSFGYKTLDTIAAFVADTEVNDIPRDLRQKIRTHVVDTLAAGLAGSRVPEASRLQAAYFIGAKKAGSPSSIWGTDKYGDPRDAAFLNAAASHVLEIDDTGGCDHSGAVIVPAVFAALSLAGEGVSLADVFLAVTVGYEVARRVQTFLGGYSSLNSKGWHSTSVCGPLGAAVAVAKLLEMDEVSVADAIGIASCSMGGTWSFKSGGGHNKMLNVASASRAGVESALLARAGCEGSKDVFEQVWGGAGGVFGRDDTDWQSLTANLGTEWTAYDAWIKPFPTCASTHPAIHLASSRLRDLVEGGESIVEIEVKVSPFVAAMCGSADIDALDTFGGRQLSIPYLIAVAIVEGTVSFADVAERRFTNDDIAGLISRVRLYADSALEDATGWTLMRITTNEREIVLDSNDFVPLRKPQSTEVRILSKARQTLEAAGIESEYCRIERLMRAEVDLSARSIVNI